MKIIQKAVIKDREKFLILKRSPAAAAFPEYWDFPGGKLEKDEDPFVGIEREIREETGLVSTAVAIVGTYEIDIEQVGYPTHRFVVFETKTKITELALSGEHTDYAWKTKGEILQLSVEPYIPLYFGQKVKT